MSHAYPVRLGGSLDPTTSRWLWIIKVLLIIPHVLLLLVLGVGVFFAWIGAFFAILFTASYPRPLFDFSVGVLRWCWRLSFYAFGVFGTDRYPPFSLDENPGYPAHLDVAYPEHLNRWLVLVKWFLAIPHLIIVGILLGSSTNAANQHNSWSSNGNIGLLSILALVAVVIFAFSGRYPQGLFDLLMGLHRWVFRVWAYLLLMTDEYPPFRLDSGGDDPATVHDLPEMPDMPNLPYYP
ncbi:MAG TPA: DUF4389 domain-containing protein [Dermatophilaceae bacterium]